MLRFFKLFTIIGSLFVFYLIATTCYEWKKSSDINDSHYELFTKYIENLTQKDFDKLIADSSAFMMHAPDDGFESQVRTTPPYWKNIGVQKIQSSQNLTKYMFCIDRREGAIWVTQNSEGRFLIHSYDGRGENMHHLELYTSAYSRS